MGLGLYATRTKLAIPIAAHLSVTKNSVNIRVLKAAMLAISQE
jgi:hypothetical protein